MKKKGRIQTSNRKRTAGETDKTREEKKKLPGSRGRPRKTATSSSRNITSLEEAHSTDDVQKPKAVKFRSPGRLGTAICRLCHGKFSSRSLRHAFQWAQDVVEELDSVAQSPLLFHTFHVDFQQLVGVPLDRDPRLSEFVCKKCHTKFYKCHSILIRFLQRVNLPPVGKENLMNQEAPNCPDSSRNNCTTTPPSFTSDPKCLRSLVSWAHHHGEACRSCPNLKEVLEGQCLGSVKAVWSCVDGHRYTMDTRQSAATNLRCTLSISGGGSGGVSGDGVASEEDEQEAVENDEDQAGEGRRTTRGRPNTPSSNSPPAVNPLTQSSDPDPWTTNAKGSAAPVVSSVAVQLEDRGVDSEMSDGVISDNDFDVTRKDGASDDELFEPYSNTRTRRSAVSTKRLKIQEVPEEPKIRKKPGPKPGWKNKLQPKREELPYIYKCPYQGCTAVYKSPDVRKKHMKEHHEEVRERPCPHPGCNKVFTIDRYLQRHIKAIHTEERNYICDQCGQTFKQRKHLFVHQLRHTGAKPLQCEVCGFQCRQRASLKYHMTKHKAEADLEFACLICQKRFEKAHNLNVHMSMIHPLTQSKSGSSKQQQQPQPPPPLYDLHTVTQQDQDR